MLFVNGTARLGEGIAAAWQTFAKQPQSFPEPRHELTSMTGDGILLTFN